MDRTPHKSIKERTAISTPDSKWSIEHIINTKHSMPYTLKDTQNYNDDYNQGHEEQPSTRYNQGQEQQHHGSTYLLLEENMREYQYVYNITSAHPKLYNVNASSFQKTKCKVKCKDKTGIFTFYESLQHIAIIFQIPMQNMQDIGTTHPVCPLNQNKCANYENAYVITSGVIYQNLEDPAIWEEYSQGWNIVSSSLHHSDGYAVLYDILSEILPKLNNNSSKNIKIERPIYGNMTSNNIYAYVAHYYSFLKPEGLGTKLCTYTLYKQASYVASDMEQEPHKRFDKAVVCIRSQLEHSPDGYEVPRDITI